MIKKNKFIYNIIITLFFILSCFVFSKIFLKPNYLDLLSDTNLVIKSEIQDLRFNSDTDNFLGDGYTEISFIYSDINELKNQKPFNGEWRKGPYINSYGKTIDNITFFSNIHNIKNSDQIIFSIRYKDLNNLEYDSSYELLVIDLENNIVLFQQMNM